MRCSGNSRALISSSGGDDDRLAALVSDFGADLTETVRSIAPTSAPFRARISDAVEGVDRIRLVQDPAEGISLTVAKSSLLNLVVEYHCSFDRARKFLAVDSSNVTVRAIGTNEPLFRYEYVREPSSAATPTAHIQIHAHRDAFVYVMTRAGTATPRGKRRSRTDGVPHLSELHFPVGGPRYRPCIEDVLEMLVDEFGIDSDAQGRQALRRGREAWRRKQLASAVRDAPEIAARTLEEELGYVITRPCQVPEDRTDKLQMA